jgi:hypothetical protein
VDRKVGCRVSNTICSTFFIFYSRGNLESGSFSYMRNSVCKYIRNSVEFRGILGNFTAKNTAEFRGIPFVFQKIPYSVGSQKRTSVDTLHFMSSIYCHSNGPFVFHVCCYLFCLFWKSLRKNQQLFSSANFFVLFVQTVSRKYENIFFAKITTTKSQRS